MSSNLIIIFQLQGKPEGDGHGHTIKWAVPDYIFSGKNYPSFLSGSGYIMSRSTAECLYTNGIKIPYIPLEVTDMRESIFES